MIELDDASLESLSDERRQTLTGQIAACSIEVACLRRGVRAVSRGQRVPAFQATRHHVILRRHPAQAGIQSSLP